MQVLPIDPSFHRVILQGNAGPEGVPLTLGQQITATVLRIDTEGQLLLDLGFQRFWARSELPLATGQEITLKVNHIGPTIELQLLDNAAEPSIENYALAALLKAGGGGPISSSSIDSAKLLEGLQQLLKLGQPPLSESQNAQLAQLLQPLSMSADAGALAGQLKNLLENSGVFFEAKLRVLLQTLDTSPEASLQQLASDLKALLGHLNRNLADALPASPLQGSEFVRSPAAAASESNSAFIGPLESSLLTPHRTPAPDSAPSAFSLPREEAPEIVVGLQGILDKLGDLATHKALASLVQDLRSVIAALEPEKSLSDKKPAVSTAGSSQSTNPAQPAQRDIALSQQLPGLAARLNEMMPELESSSDPKLQKLLPELKALISSTGGPAPSSRDESVEWKALLLDQKNVLAQQVLSRQAEAAYHRLNDGGLQVELPLQFGSSSTSARIRFFQESAKEEPLSSERPLSINIYLDLPNTGKLEASARWYESQLQATLFVRDEAVKAMFAQRLEELAEALEVTGYTTVQLDVSIDPMRLYKPAEPSQLFSPREGSLLSLRV